MIILTNEAHTTHMIAAHHLERNFVLSHNCICTRVILHYIEARNTTTILLAANHKRAGRARLQRCTPCLTGTIAASCKALWPMLRSDLPYPAAAPGSAEPSRVSSRRCRLRTCLRITRHSELLPHSNSLQTVSQITFCLLFRRNKGARGGPLGPNTHHCYHRAGSRDHQ